MEDIKIGLKEIVADFDLSSSNEYNRGLAILCGDALNRLEQLEKENEELKFDIILKNAETDYLRKNYIPKSKIREELRTLKNMLPTTLHETSRAVFNGEIALLERILGED